MAEEHGNENAVGATEQQTNDANFSIKAIYLKDCSFESPNSPAVFQQNHQPEFQVNISSTVNPVQENFHEVVLTLSITAVVEENKNIFLVEVQQAGLFESAGLNPQQLHHVLGTFAPAQLFPYAREAANSMVVKGGFPSIMLQPVNFDALYAQYAQQLAQQQAAAAQQNPPVGNA